MEEKQVTQQMNIHQAFSNVANASGEAKLSRQEHSMIQLSLKVLADFIIANTEKKEETTT